MLAASYNNTYRGKESDIEYKPGESVRNGVIHRDYSVQQSRLGSHLKLDYTINKWNQITWYNGFMDMREAEVRDGFDDVNRSVRLEWNHQYIFNRTSFCNYYTFNSDTGSDWENFDDIEFYPRRSYGNIGGALNYDASEKIGAAYAMVKYTLNDWEINGGVRAEHTDQGYQLLFPEESVDPEGNQKYWDILPSLHLKYGVHKNANLRFSYARAINRPSFFEIAPYSIIGDDYKEEGNPDLKHTVADNLDLRYEFFPGTSGLFYKNIQDPIEYGLITEGQDLKYKPMNFGTARNFGVEVDIMKYFNWFGVKANYTYTHSAITTTKRQMNGNNVEMIEQTRPLYGQAAHVANLSLLFRSPKHGWEGQILGSYTGKRLADISSWYNDDIWEAGYFQLDASLEKSFKFGLTLFAKASNLLNTPILRYIQNGPHTVNVDSRRENGNVVERESRSGQTFMIGLRYKL